MYASIVKFLESGGPIYTDIVSLFVVFLVFFFYTMYFGKGRIISAVFAYYPAVLLYNIFPFGEKVLLAQGENLLILNKIGLFLVFFIPLNIIINRYIFAESVHIGASHVFRTAGFAIALLIMILLFSHTIVSLDIIHHFSPMINGLFTGTTRIFLWNLAPLVLLAFL